MQSSDDFKEAERKAMTQQPFTIGHLDGGVKFYVFDDMTRNRHERRAARARARRKQPPGKRRH